MYVCVPGEEGGGQVRGAAWSGGGQGRDTVPTRGQRVRPVAVCRVSCNARTESLDSIRTFFLQHTRGRKLFGSLY